MKQHNHNTTNSGHKQPNNSSDTSERQQRHQSHQQQPQQQPPRLSDAAPPNQLLLPPLHRFPAASNLKSSFDGVVFAATSIFRWRSIDRWWCWMAPCSCWMVWRCGGSAGSDGNGLEIDALCRGDGREEIDGEFSAVGFGSLQYV
jgi:hypothetical protein